MPAATPLDEGIYVVQVTATDVAGNSGQGTSQLTVDKTGPVVTVNPVSPTNANNEHADFERTVSDAVSGVTGDVTVKIIGHATPDAAPDADGYGRSVDPQVERGRADSAGRWELHRHRLGHGRRLEHQRSARGGYVRCGHASSDRERGRMGSPPTPVISNTATPTLTGKVSDSGSGVNGVAVVLVGSNGSKYSG